MDERLRHRLPIIAFVLIFFSVWELAVRAGDIIAVILPAPSAVVVRLFSDISAILPHLRATVAATLIGLGTAALLSLLIALAMHRSRSIRSLLHPVLVASQAIPLIAVAPLFLVWFGFGLTPRVVVVILITMFPVTVTTLSGLDSVEAGPISLLLTMNASSVQLFRFVQLPAALGALFSGLRISATYAVMGAIIGEWLGGSLGLGVYMLRAQRAFDLERVFAAIILVVILTLLIAGVAGLGERSLHHRTGRGGTS